MPLLSPPDAPPVPAYAPPNGWNVGAATPAASGPADAPAGVPAAVEVVGVSKSFRARRGWRAFLRRPMHAELARVLDRVSFTVQPGEFFGLLGPNGAGKTTLFRVLATSVLPDAGHAAVCGYDVDRNVARVRGSVSCVMANDRSLFWRLSAAENLRLFAALYALPHADTTRRVGEVLALVGLADVGAKPVGNYSAGMRQRLLIARALLPRPRVLLLDEPTRSLDPIAAREFRRFLRTDVATAEGCTVLLATHSSEEALTLCDRLAVLHRGRVLATGTAAELQARFGDRAFHVWTRTPTHAAFAALEGTGRARRDGPPQAEAGEWWRVRLVVGGALEDAGAVLTALSAAGADVARFEQADLDLAELLERVVARESSRQQPAA